MRINFEADFWTDGDFCFRDFDKLLDKNNSLYKGADINFRQIHDGEQILICLSANGDANACRWAMRDLLEHMMCSINTHKYYLLKNVYDVIYYFHDGLWGDMNQDKDISMGGNYDGTYLALHMREN